MDESLPNDKFQYLPPQKKVDVWKITNAPKRERWMLMVHLLLQQPARGPCLSLLSSFKTAGYDVFQYFHSIRKWKISILNHIFTFITFTSVVGVWQHFLGYISDIFLDIFQNIFSEFFQIFLDFLLKIIFSHLSLWPVGVWQQCGQHQRSLLRLRREVGCQVSLQQKPPK